MCLSSELLLQNLGVPPIFCFCGIIWYSLSLPLRAFLLASRICKDQAGTPAAAMVYEQDLYTMLFRTYMQ